jgi:radical SAM protein with 4Fe4S-binding SPASM domain
MRKLYTKVYIEISNICNLQCGFCPEVVRSKKLIDLELFRRIIEQVAPLTEQVCFHLMGDPLVHPKLKDLVQICHHFGVPIFFVTNGVLLKKMQAELLLHSAFRQVNFSLHSFKDNFPDRDPTEYLNRIFTFTESAFVNRPDLFINYRLWNLNDPRGTLTDNLDILTRIEKRFALKITNNLDVQKKKSVHLSNRLYLHFDTEFVWPGLERAVLGSHGTCYGLSSHFGILVDGTLVPCCLDKEGAIPLGNVNEQTIPDILKSKRAQAILKGFRERNLVEALCQRCQYIERFASAKPKLRQSQPLD